MITRRAPVRPSLVLPLVAAFLPVIAAQACTPSRPAVVVYVAEQQRCAEPVLQAFSRASGIAVTSVYDRPERLVVRLLDEVADPRADVLWATDPVQGEVVRDRKGSTAYLSPNARGVPAPFNHSGGYWTGFAARVSPISVRPHGGDNRYVVADGGDLFAWLTRGEAFPMLLPAQKVEGTGDLVIPDVAVPVQAAPHARAGRKLIDYLLSADAERRLAFDCGLTPLHPDVETPAGVQRLESLRMMNVDYALIAAEAKKLPGARAIFTKAP